MSKLITPPFTGSYVHLDKAFSLGESPEKFSIQIVLPKGDPFWKKVRKAELALAKEKGLKKSFRSTVNDGDATDREEVQGCNFMTVSCDADRRPEVVDKNKDPIIETGQLYSGAIYIVSIRGYAWSNKYGEGVSFGLNNAMKVADGTPLGGGRSTADDDFDDLDLSEFLDEPADDSYDEMI